MFKVMIISTVVGMALSGAAVGAFQERRLDHALNLAERGHCPAHDVDGNFYWKQGCVDQQFVDAIADATVNSDRETASVFEQMAKNQPKPKPAKKTVRQ